MADFTFKVPPELSQSMKRLMDQMKKLNDAAEKINQTAAFEFPTSNRQQTVTQSQRLHSSVRRLETTLQRSVDQMSFMVGASARLIIRGFTIEAFVVKPIYNVLGLLSGGVAPIFLATAIGAFRWLWDKTTSLGDAILRDQLIAISTGGTVSSLRAFRATFGTTIPGAENLIEPVAATQFDRTTRLAVTLSRAFRIADNIETSQRTVMIIREIRRQLRAWPAAVALLRARERWGGQLDEQTLVALRNMSDEEFERVTDRFSALYLMTVAEPLFTGRYDDMKAWVTFTLAFRDMWFKIDNSIGKALADSGIVTALANVVRAFRGDESHKGVIDTTLELPIAKDAMKFIQDKLTDLAHELETTKPTDLIPIVNSMIESFEKGSIILLQFMEDFKVADTRQTRDKLRLDIIGRQLGVPVAPPGWQPSAPAFPLPPSRGGYTPRPGAPIALPPGVRRGTPSPGSTGPGVPPSPAPNYTPVPRRGGYTPVPRAPTAAPGQRQTYATPPSNLAADRAGYARELENNPALRERILRIAANEQGSNPEGTQAVIESMMNRASVRHTTLEQQAHWTSEGGYYSDGNKGVGIVDNPAKRAVLEQSLKNAIGGSNVANYATGNASNAPGNRLADRRIAEQGGYLATFNGEYFFHPNADERRDLESWGTWRTSVSQGTPATPVPPGAIHPAAPGAAWVGPNQQPSLPQIPGAVAPAGQLTSVPRDFSRDNAGNRMDPVVFAQAENIARTGDVHGVYQFITSHGGHVDAAYCGDFVGAVVRAGGGNPPRGYPVATSWANYGTPVRPGEEQPGDIAIYMRGHQPGETGGHVGIVGSQGALGNGRFQFFGANTTEEITTSESGVIFRRPPGRLTIKSKDVPVKQHDPNLPAEFLHPDPFIRRRQQALEKQKDTGKAQTSSQQNFTPRPKEPDQKFTPRPKASDASIAPGEQKTRDATPRKVQIINDSSEYIIRWRPTPGAYAN